LKLYTTKQASELLERSPSTIRVLCWKWDIGKVVGGVRVLDEVDMLNLRNRKGKVGRRPKVKYVVDRAS
jgi:hypothetical protein